jgi:hypothetical protein
MQEVWCIQIYVKKKQNLQNHPDRKGNEKEKGDHSLTNLVSYRERIFFVTRKRKGG